MMIRLKFFSPKNKIIHVVFLIVSVFCISCNFASPYTNLINRELQSGEQVNDLIMGFKFGMTKDLYFDKCTELNKSKIITSGGRNFSPEKILTPKNPNGKKIKMSFFGTFDEQRLLNGFDVRFNYLGWSNWNKEYQSPVLIEQIKDSVLKWFPGNNFLTVEIEGLNKKTHVKVDGNRRILLYIVDSKDVALKIDDLTNLKLE